MNKFTLLLIIFILSSFSALAEDGQWRLLIADDTYDCWVNPKRPETIYVGSGSRVVYRTYDAGMTWDTLVIGFKSGPALFNNIFCHPIDTSVVIVGGLNFQNVRKSTNSGNEWYTVLQHPTDPIMLNGKALLMKPDDPETFYIGDYRNSIIYRSTDRGENWDSISTITKTETFYDEENNPYDSTYRVPIGCIGIRDDSTNILFTGATNSEMYISTDHGVTWKLTDRLVLPDHELGRGDCEITRIIFSKRNPLVGYAVITYLIYNNTPNGGLHKTTDGGYTWEMLAFPDTSIWAVGVRDNGVADEILIGGYTEDYAHPPEYRVGGIGMVRRSTDGGQTWINYDDEIPWASLNYKNVMNYYSISTPMDSKLYIAGQYGQALFSYNGGDSYENRYRYTDTTFYDIEFVDSDNGWLIGEQGIIFRSTDTGYIWELQESHTSFDLKDVFFPTKQTGYIVGDHSVILKSTDAGLDWERVNIAISTNFKSVFFLNDSDGFVAGENGNLVFTQNGGDLWQELDIGTNNTINDIIFKNGIGYLVGNNGLFMKSLNGGMAWDEYETSSNDSLMAISAYDNDTLLIVGEKNTILRSTDGGINWTRIEHTNTHTLNDVKFINDSSALAIGNFRTILESDDRGKNWYYRNFGIGPVANMWSTRYFSTNEGDKLYLSSEAGFLVFENFASVQEEPTKPHGKLTIKELSDNRILAEYISEQELGHVVEIRMVNLEGKTLFTDKINSDGNGKYQYYINKDKFPSGVYIIQFLDGGTSLSEKFIIE